VSGRKRYLLVDSQGMILGIHITAADILDEHGGMYLLYKVAARYPSLEKVWVDGAFRGLFAAYAWHLHGIEVEMSIQRKERNCEVTSKRWVVERTFAWLGRYRRLSKDYEFFCQTSENWIYLAMSHLLVKRLGRMRAF
jgi:putative transposase